MYDIVPYHPALKPQVAMLQRHLWRGDAALNTAYFEWTAALPAETVTKLEEMGFVHLDHGPLGRHLPSVLVRTVSKKRLTAEPTLGARRLLDPATWDMRMMYSMAG